jgi:thioredoxin-related protein
MKEESSSVAAFMKEHNYSSRVLLDLEGKAARKYDVYGIPVSYLIDRKGNIVYRLSGYIDWGSSEIRSLVNSLIKEQT